MKHLKRERYLHLHWADAVILITRKHHCCKTLYLKLYAKLGLLWTEKQCGFYDLSD